MSATGDSVETPTLAQVIQAAVKAQLLDLHVCLPGKILNYAPATQKADVEVLLKKKYKVAGVVDIPVLNSVPVQWPSASGGKSFLHLPLAVGDLGMVIFVERSIDRWLSGDGSAVVPDTARTHDLSDGFFIPGVRPFDVAIASAVANNAVLQNDKLRIEIDPSGKISIEGSSKEMVTVLSQTIADIISGFQNTAQAVLDTSTATVIIPGGSSAGTYPLDPTTVAALVADKAAIDADVTALQQDKADLDTLKRV